MVSCVVFQFKMLSWSSKRTLNFVNDVAVIGKGGEHISMIQNGSGVKVQFAPGE